MKWLVLAVALGFLGLAQGRSEGDARIVVARSVKTAIAFNTVTSTNPVTCIFAANAAVCQRRRFRRFMPIIDHENQETLVDSSLDKDTDDEEEDVPRQGKRGGRIAVTLWTTVSSTFTITTTSTDTLTTFSLSYFCTVNGASSPPSCGMKWLIFALTLGVLSLVEGRDALDARIVAARSTKTAFFITTSTTVTPFTCAFATQGDVCQKRRYRRYSHINDRQLELDKMKWLVLGILLAVLSTTQGRNPEDGKVVAAHTTRTAIVLTTSTTVRPFTCALATNPEVCQKRRFRRYSAIADQLLENDGPSLDGSLLGLVDQDSESSARKPRIALNIIFTTSSTYTVTATSTNRAITFSLSFFCTVNGASYPPACG